MAIEDLYSSLPAFRIEYHRNVLALVPEKNDDDPGIAVLVINNGKTGHTLQCSCSVSEKRKKCFHVKKLSGAVRKSGGIKEAGWIDEMFRKSSWYRMAVSLQNACPVDPATLKAEIKKDAVGKTTEIRILEPDGHLLVLYFADHEDARDDETMLLLERTRIQAGGGDLFHRGGILDMLSVMTMTQSEQMMHARGLKNRRMAIEQSFWYRLAYHFRNVTSKNTASITTDIDRDTGRLVICCRSGKSPKMEIAVPKSAAMQVLREIEKDFCDRAPFSLWPQSLESIVKVCADRQNDVKLYLYLLLHLPDGSTEAIERRRLEKYWYGNTVYIPDKQVLATWKKPDMLWGMFGGKYTKKIRRDRLPEVIEKIGDIFSSPNIVDKSVSRLKIYRKYSRVEIAQAAMERNWCWLSVSYGFGKNVKVSLADIYNAQMAGNQYLPVDDGWVDTRGIDTEALTSRTEHDIAGQLAAGNNRLRLSKMDLFRLNAAFEGPVQVSEKEEASGETGSDGLHSILEMQPPVAVENLSEMSGTLRRYQQHGAGWLAFLHQNRFGGLLCDEMGLGKTHQVMAVMVWLAKNRQEQLPHLVVCPTTVLSHWERKIRHYAQGLTAAVYHGTDREIEKMKNPGTVLITSYGVLLRDITRLSRMKFSVAAFDEAQYLKNPVTKSYAAAAAVRADLKIAVTGTPVENRLGDLKALLDLVLPGYLGTDETFQARYESGGKQRRQELRRIIAPFAMRRTKSAVLDELPEKIEDIRYCRLTDTQIRLYREAVAGRGADLRNSLEYGDDEIPYIHIFALLTLLKQICNHPASISVEKPGIDALSLDSGKWELFVELVDACLENREKIVIFSQFVSMVNLILDYLKGKEVQTAVITGRTRNRKKEIDRFNNDPDCRVFVGSIKAGGSGIDLTGGSVVIHYDRWWNAAKEDQATDRVHRIGQTLGVQVFKLVTEGTLEEKISAIIDRKKNLMDDVIAEDDPGVLKTFTRNELIDLISMPE